MAAFEKAHAELDAEGIRVVGASSDPRDKAHGTADDGNISFALGIGLDPEETAATLGAFYEPRRHILHATGFVIRPDASVALACYSTGPIGRLLVDDVLGLVRFYKKQGS